METNKTLQTEKTLTRLIRPELTHHPSIEEYMINEDKNKLLYTILFWTIITLIIITIGM